jgi:hypothetical protein
LPTENTIVPTDNSEKLHRFLGALALLALFGTAFVPLHHDAHADDQSDGPAVSGHYIRPTTSTVRSGGSAKLRLVHCQATAGASKARLVCEGEKAYMGQATPAAAVRWEVAEGPGRVRGDKQGAMYDAPAAVQADENEASVAATLTYPDSKEMRITFATIKINTGAGGPEKTGDDKGIQTYAGTFRLHDVTVNSEYTTDIAGNIEWNFDEYYEEGRWREYTGTGTATLKVKRVWCGPASFSGVTVEGRMKVYDDKRYEFLINLVGDREQTKQCDHGDFKWEETYSEGGSAVATGDACGMKELFQRYTVASVIAYGDKGTCQHVLNQFERRWSFKAVK